MIKRVALFLFVVTAVPALLISLPVWADEEAPLNITVFLEGSASTPVNLWIYTDSGVPFEQREVTGNGWQHTTKPRSTGLIFAMKTNNNACSTGTPGNIIPLKELDAFLTHVTVNYNGTSCAVTYSIPINNCQELQNVETDKSYFLEKDINCNNAQMKPLAEFNGTFLGNGKKISNLNILGDAGDVGLFKSFSGNISRVIFEKISINSTNAQDKSARGLIAGKTTNAMISDITVNDLKIYGGAETQGGVSGGLVGHAEDASFSGVFINNLSIARTAYVGGVIGSAGHNVTIKDALVTHWVDNSACTNPSSCPICSNTTDPFYQTGSCGVGGLMGLVAGENISINTSAVRPGQNNAGPTIYGSSNVGGLVGLVHPTAKLNIADSYARMGISAVTYAGGLIGRSDGALYPGGGGLPNNVSLKNIYVAGNVYALNKVGNEYTSKAVLGNSVATTESVVSEFGFFDRDVKGTYAASSGDENNAVGAVTKSESSINMEASAIYEQAGWSKSIWCLIQSPYWGYPSLRTIDKQNSDYCVAE